LYRTEKGDSRLWYQGVQNIQYLNAPEERFEKPDWAAKYHFAMAPVYYHNYLLGEMLASQFDHTLRTKADGKVLTPEGGRWFVDNVFTPGAKYSWDTMIERATGEKLNRLSGGAVQLLTSEGPGYLRRALLHFGTVLYL